MKKIFGGINLTWPKVIIMAVLAGVYTATMAMLPIARNTSFHDIAVTFEVWILFGIFIIMNSKSAKDSALKCLVFFAISQPLVYLVQDVINGSQLFKTYYRFWIGWTIGCVPMGFIGYYMKKDKWWGLLILTPIMGLLGCMYAGYLSQLMFSFPRHILTVIFCIVTLLMYPLAIFKEKKIRITGLIINILIIIVCTACCLIKPPVYNTTIFLSGEEYQFDDSYKAYLKDSKYGDLSIKYDEGIESYMLNAEFKKSGKTEIILESPTGEKTTYELKIERDKFDYKLK